MTPSPERESVRALLLDVEGTTTPIAFVYRTLFPYARDHLSGFLRAHGEAAARSVAALRAEWTAEPSPPLGLPAWDRDPVSAAGAYALWLMEADRKSTALKTLQGQVWRAGYENGELRGEVFDDVQPAFARWKARGLGIDIFSSGSVLAQQLLFRHSRAGDLTRYLGGYFDTTTGGKTASGSYAKIASALGVDPGAVVFVSDSAGELDAAAAAGCRVVLSLRQGNSPVPEPGRYQAVHTFDELM